MTRPGDRASRGLAVLGHTAEPSSANGREPPHDLPVEAAGLAAMLLSADAARLVLAGPLRAEHFYSPAHRHIFTAVQDLVAAESPVDVVVVESLLRDRGLLDLVVGPSFLDQLGHATPAAEHVEAHAKIVFDKWRIRRVPVSRIVITSPAPS
jgi:replicative DNA helicase